MATTANPIKGYSNTQLGLLKQTAIKDKKNAQNATLVQQIATVTQVGYIGSELSTLVPASYRVARGARSGRRAGPRAAAVRERRSVACVRARHGAWASEGV
eukprot:602975-Pleurochrysis_carterae.AAC.1